LERKSTQLYQKKQSHYVCGVAKGTVVVASLKLRSAIYVRDWGKPRIFPDMDF